MSASPFLSFCIPSYNQLYRVSALVKSLLLQPDDDIEVVILDNASTDGTFKELNKIIDSRLKLVVNSKNNGALYNMINVFSYASGEYVVYSTDKDITNVNEISNFKSFLRANRHVSCGYCNLNQKNKINKNYFFSSGYAAVNAIAYKGRHPTGYFFKNKELCKIKLNERFADFNIVDLFPLEFAFAEIAMMGTGAIYGGNIFKPNTGQDGGPKTKSATTNGTSKNAFFAPATRLKLAINYSRHAEQLSLNRINTLRLQAKIFVSELGGATIGYRRIMKNERLCDNYHMKCRKVGYWEILFISTSFIRKYFTQRFTHKKLIAVIFIFFIIFNLY